MVSTTWSTIATCPISRPCEKTKPRADRSSCLAPENMNIRVQFFAQLKEVTSASALGVDLPEGTRVSELLEEIYRRVPALRVWDNSLLVGSGVEFVDRNYVIQS